MAIKDTDRNNMTDNRIHKIEVPVKRIDLFVTDEGIRRHIESIEAEGISVQSYIMDLIREDMTIKDMVRATLLGRGKKQVTEPLMDREAFAKVQEKIRETKKKEVRRQLEQRNDKDENGDQ